MNYRYAGYLLAQMLLIVGGFMFIPFLMAILYHESHINIISFGLTMGSCMLVGLLGCLLRPKKDQRRLSKYCGLVICGLGWILISLVSAIPYRTAGVIPNYLDAVWESISGYTTTGATVITDIESVSKSFLYFRATTQWFGGMGVLVIMIAILSKHDKASIALAKAEMPGPQFGKLVSKLRFTTRILYSIYIVLTLILFGILVLCGMPVFDSICHAFTTASTGGFSIKANSIAAYDSVAIETVLTVFMILFSVNFNIFYLILAGQGLKALKDEELWWMIGLFVFATLACTLYLLPNENYPEYDTFGESLRYSSFHVASILSTTGFSTADYTTWPIAPQFLLCFLMVIGGSAGSTSGGIKVSRFVILAKSSGAHLKKNLSPRSITSVRFNGQSMHESYLENIHHFFSLYLLIVITSVFLVACTIPSPDAEGFERSFTAVITCISNVGPGLGNIGPLYTFESFHPLAKIVLCIDMLIGRLEIYPIILLFSFKVWKPVKN